MANHCLLLNNVLSILLLETLIYFYISNIFTAILLVVGEYFYLAALLL